MKTLKPHSDHCPTFSMLIFFRSKVEGAQNHLEFSKIKGGSESPPKNSCKFYKKLNLNMFITMESTVSHLKKLTILGSFSGLIYL